MPVYDIRHEGKLYSDVEGVRNAFEFGNVTMEGIHNKGLKNGLKTIAKKNKSKSAEYSKDSEVMNEVKHGSVITAYYTNNTN